MKKFFSAINLIILLTLAVNAREITITREEKIYKEVKRQRLKVIIFSSSQPGEKGGKPAIAFFHGGGWVFGKPEEFDSACERYARKGFVTFSFQYRLSVNDDGTYPNPGITPLESVMDARSAIRWLRINAGSFGINPQKIIAGGQSAGGQLALSTALMDSINEETDNLGISPSPNALLLYSSNVNTMEAWVDWILGDRRSRIWSISPYHNLRKNMPPIIAFHGEDDCTVLAYTVNLFAEKMKELGNYYELITYKGRQHYLGEGNEKYARYFDEEILERTDKFLKQFGFMVE
jgi:acetyl esterase